MEKAVNNTPEKGVQTTPSSNLPRNEPVTVSIRIRKDDYERLVEFQGKVMERTKKKLFFHEMIHRMINVYTPTGWLDDIEQNT